MDKERKDELDILRNSELFSLNKQIEEKLKNEFSDEERKIHDAYFQQIYTSENSPAYGSKESQDKAKDSAQRAYDRGTMLVAEKVAQRKAELEKARDGIIDKIYQYDGGSYDEAMANHNKWLEEQAKTRTQESNPNLDSRQQSQEEKSAQATHSIKTEFNDPKPSIVNDFNERSQRDNEVDYDRD